MLLGILFLVSLALMVCFWLMRDSELRTKIIFPVIWVGSVVGCFSELSYLFGVLLVTVDSLLWWLTFGPNVPTRRI